MTSTRKPLFQVGMAEMIGVLSVFSIVFGAMWAPTAIFQTVLLLVLVLVAVMLTVAVSGKGVSRVFAQGFVAWAAVYLLAFVMMESRLEVFHRREIPLPTTVLWGELQLHISEFRYRHHESQAYSNVISRGNYGEIFDASGNLVGRMHNGIAKGQLGVDTEIAPTSGVFYVTGQLLWVLGLGYLIGKFAVGFRRYQENVQSAAASDKDLASDG
ncbi:hypothetical protein [Blastopirellula marina]|uniref:Uncharacterized protein n=1 Tax=Blastopirellula marina TaxID=124 RepID=A0A2S8GCZ0_9BACT|nr:hypothetical protein [Blastopirellula marina]PQO42121.1 hypothetical protein C5Y93_27630 [Blastopirellula marina]